MQSIKAEGTGYTPDYSGLTTVYAFPERNRIGLEARHPKPDGTHTTGRHVWMTPDQARAVIIALQRALMEMPK